MESLHKISKIEISVDKIFYDKSSEIFSVDILGFTFVGHYRKSTKIKVILDDICRSLGDIGVERKDIYLLDANGKLIPETKKLRDLKPIKRKKKEEKPKKKKVKREKKVLDEVEEFKIKEREIENKLKRKANSKDEEEFISEVQPFVPSEIGPPKGAPPAKEREYEEPITPRTITYYVNMGFQYYSVMMEQKSYLFYVFFSHEELKIIDEKGKVIYKTTLEIITTKEEPPILDLRIEGEGFDVHPLTGKVIVKKDAINPPVMIFSVLPIKSSKKERKKRKKKSERRLLHIYIDFKNKTINHTVLSIIVQPKHFHLDLGPIQLDISKRTAMLISFLSALFATISTIYSTITLETSSIVEVLSGYFPGLASFIFVTVFIITLIKNGIYPLKKKWSAFLNFDKTSPMMK